MMAKPYLIFLGDAHELAMVKTGCGLRDWCPDDVVGEYALPSATVTLGLQPVLPRAAAARGARSLVIGVASFGGAIPESWWPALFEAIDAGLDIVSGMHDRLAGVPGLADHAARAGRQLHDVRHSSRRFAVGSGRRRTGRRVLTVGTDCALGKKYTALAVARGLAARGVPATFRATGQTGIMIAGDGIAIDAVVADFIAGAAEALSPDAAADHWDVIEGQGSLFHPAYAGVSLGLLHGSQPDAIILCHDPARVTLDSYPDFPIPDLGAAIELHLALGRRTNPAICCAGVSLNTSRLADDERARLLARTARDLGVPVFDPLRDDLGPVVDRILTCA